MCHPFDVDTIVTFDPLLRVPITEFLIEGLLLTFNALAFTFPILSETEELLFEVDDPLTFI